MDERTGVGDEVGNIQRHPIMNDVGDYGMGRDVIDNVQTGAEADKDPKSHTPSILPTSRVGGFGGCYHSALSGPNFREEKCFSGPL